MGSAGAFVNVAERSVSERGDDIRFVLVDAGHDDAGLGRLFFDPPDDFEPVEARHRQVCDQEIGMKLDGQTDRFASIPGLSDQMKVGFLLQQLS